MKATQEKPFIKVIQTAFKENFAQVFFRLSSQSIPLCACALLLKSNVTQARRNYILLLSLRAGCCQLSPTPLKNNFTLFAIPLLA
jgi:hypothetical protein